MKALLQKALPENVYSTLVKRAKLHFDNQYIKQGSTEIDLGNYKIEIPKNHSAISFHKDQPYRDLCVGITAKYVSEKYPNGTIVDIGANVGDTAAIIATHSSNKMILVEASDYFYDILLRNVRRFPNETVVKKVLISDGSEIKGYFYHWGGTASFNEDSKAVSKLKSEQLSEVADAETHFIKTDTDGYDFKILSSSLEWLNNKKPIILFENQVQKLQDFNDSNELLDKLAEIGYSHFIVWDDPGFHILSTNSLDSLKDLNRYLYKKWQYQGSKICNYDILCAHKKDEDIYRKIREWYMDY